jgi:hypothetical protein
MDWHRLFCLFLYDFFTGSPFHVDSERDLSVQVQRVDVILLRQGPGPFAGPLPDGLDDLAAYNLITFKSHHEALDDWALKELIGAYVSYRKMVSPSTKDLLPETDFRLYAVCARYPNNLAGQVPWEEQRPGVYRCRWGTDSIQVVVLRQLPRAERNAPLHLFSAAPELVQFGQGHYRQRSQDTSSLLLQLFQGYQGEGLVMPYTMEDFRRDFAKSFLKSLAPEERREALQSLPTGEIVKNLPVDEVIKSLPVEEVLKSLPPEKIAEYVQQHGKTSRPSPQKRKGSRKGRNEPER